jgi:hypothetical protein
MNNPTNPTKYYEVLVGATNEFTGVSYFCFLTAAGAQTVRGTPIKEPYTIVREVPFETIQKYLEDHPAGLGDPTLGEIDKAALHVDALAQNRSLIQQKLVRPKIALD